MRKCIGIICIVLGVSCLLSAIGFVIYNQWEAKNAGETTQTLLENVHQILDENKINNPSQSDDGEQEAVQNGGFTEDALESTEIMTVKVDGYDCIGILSVPVLELELPVLADWSYEKLKKAPCHYYGSYYEKDFVIAAHNYKTHFGRLSELQAGDIVVFTDISGTAHYYKVELLETLPQNATKEMITSGFDLSLYTCTLGGGSRVTVRCYAVKDGK